MALGWQGSTYCEALRLEFAEFGLFCCEHALLLRCHVVCKLSCYDARRPFSGFFLAAIRWKIRL